MRNGICLSSTDLQLQDSRCGDYYTIHAACEVTRLSAAAQAQVRKVDGQQDVRVDVQHVGYDLRAVRLRCRHCQTGGGGALGLTPFCMVRADVAGGADDMLAGVLLALSGVPEDLHE